MKIFRSTHAIAEGELTELHMMATMGNAFCFPLQTVIFASVVAAAYRVIGLPLDKGGIETQMVRNVETGEIEGIIPRRYPPNWGVFGDDIVVLEEAFGTVVRVLTGLGFFPNTEKSFSKKDGSFRESCGADYYHGVNVRGVYVKNLRTPKDWYVLINNLTDWSARHGFLLINTMAWLLQKVQRVEVPPWENPEAGIRIPLCCVQTPSVFRAPFVSKREASYQGSYLYKRWVPRSAGVKVCDEVLATEVGYWNSSAILLAAIKGSLRNGEVTVRFWDPPYRKRWGVAPCWDYALPGSVQSDTWSAWSTLARVYFGAESAH